MPDTTHPTEMLGFVLTHALLRNELPRLAAALAGGPMRAEEEPVLEEQLRLVTDHLHRHHQEEDEFLWPLLTSRAPGAGRLLALLEAEHTELDPLVDVARDRGFDRHDRASALSRLSELVLAHLEAEDRSVLPLLTVHVTTEEEREGMARSRAAIPKADELRVLAMLLAAADEAQRSQMLAPLPPVVVTGWSEREAPALRAVHRLLAQIAERRHEGGES